MGIEREAGDSSYSSPLLRVNIGFPRDVEVLSEFEYDADEGRVGEAAIGFKWIPFKRSLNVGVEALTLLPVSREGGAGVESMLLATVRRKNLRVHVNAGGFYDGRPASDEHGWKSGVIVEVLVGRLRPGAEVFAKQVDGEAAQVLAGPGIIIDLGPFDVRTGLHLGLSSAAADLSATVWVTRKWPLW